MLLTEQSLAKAVRALVNEAQIPHPSEWSIDMDEQFVRDRLFPAMMKSLREIEDVRPCFGFDLERAIEIYLRGEDMAYKGAA